MKAARTRALHRKHAGTSKHASTAKHTPTAHRKAATAHKQTARRTAATVKAAHLRAWSPDEDVALCSARAFAESLRLATGRAVTDSAVLDVYWATAGDADSGASIVATAEAILAGGLAGHALLDVVENGRVVGMNPDARLDLDHALAQETRGAVIVDGQLETGFGEHARLVSHPSSIILGLALPEPHTVAVGPDGTWWSWGEPHSPEDFPGALVEEAWAVTWQ